MLKLIILILCFVFVGCSTPSRHQEKLRLAERVQQEEVRSLNEMHAHVQLLLETHPEIDSDTKLKVGKLLDEAIDKHQALKVKETQVLQLLLTLTINRAALDTQQLKDKNNLKKELAKIYSEKSENALGAIQKMSDLIQPQNMNETLRRDLSDMLRGLR